MGDPKWWEYKETRTAEEIQEEEIELYKEKLRRTIDEAVRLIRDRVPTDRKDLADAIDNAHYLPDVEIPWEIMARITGGMPAQKIGGPPVKISDMSGDVEAAKRSFRIGFAQRYYGWEQWDIKPAHLNIRDREERCNAIATDINGTPTNKSLKAWEKILTRWRKDNPDYKKHPLFY